MTGSFSRKQKQADKFTTCDEADKYNLSSVSDADREIPARGKTDNGGNEVYRVSGITR